MAHLLALKVDQREREWASAYITEGTEHYIVSVIGSEIVHWANLSPRQVSGFLEPLNTVNRAESVPGTLHARAENKFRVF